MENLTNLAVNDPIYQIIRRNVLSNRSSLLIKGSLTVYANCPKILFIPIKIM